MSPDDDNYNAPLFLDCCALVSRAVHDLRFEFGFQLGRGNQAYQYDTLPIEVEQDKMEPGDLIFYSARYYNPKHLQKHDLVHVEVYLGGKTGEQSIGSRSCRGFVQVHDSFKFVSPAYHSVQYHFRSLETWLSGICKSWCAEHSWQLFRYSITNGNNHELVMKFLGKTMVEQIDGARNFGKCRMRWTQRTFEIDYANFVEGQHVVNHLRNGDLITGTLSLFNEIKSLAKSMESGRI